MVYRGVLLKKRASVIFSFFLLVGCQTTDVDDLTAYGDTESGLVTLPAKNYYASDEYLVLAKNDFKAGDYGKANRAYLKAVKLFPQDPEAWLGLAATFDRLHRFDQSDKAYRVLSRMIGGRPEYYNNVGYSYLLRGNLRAARKNFLKAYELDPSNEITANNLQMLRSSIDFAKRS